MHISYESGILENPAKEPREEMFEMTRSLKAAPQLPVKLEIEFKKGIPTLVKHNDRFFKEPVDILSFLNSIGGEHGIGRIDIVENRFIGLKVSFV